MSTPVTFKVEMVEMFEDSDDRVMTHTYLAYCVYCGEKAKKIAPRLDSDGEFHYTCAECGTPLMEVPQ